MFVGARLFLLALCLSVIPSPTLSEVTVTSQIVGCLSSPCPIIPSIPFAQTISGTADSNYELPPGPLNITISDTVVTILGIVGGSLNDVCNLLTSENCQLTEGQPFTVVAVSKVPFGAPSGAANLVTSLKDVYGDTVFVDNTPVQVL